MSGPRLPAARSMQLAFIFMVTAWARFGVASGAEEPQKPPVFDGVRQNAWSADAWLGLGSANITREKGEARRYLSQAIWGANLTYRVGLLEFGACVDLANEIFGPSYAHFGALGGVSWEPAAWLNTELLFEIGGNEILGVGDGLYSKSVGGSTKALLPYAGIRGGFTGRFGKQSRFIAGLWVLGRHDLMQRKVDVDVEDENCFTACSSRTVRYRVGGISYGGGIRVGAEF